MLSDVSHTDPQGGSPGSPPDDGFAGIAVAPDGPVRRCIATGEVRPKETLIRFVLSPDGVVTPDIAGKLPGRGLYTLADRAALAAAIKKKSFSRAARQAATVPEDLPGMVESLLARRCIDTISLARRAGEAVTGFEKASSLLRSGKARVYVMARDTAEDGAGKLRRLCPGAPCISVLTRDELGEAFGRDDAVHVVIAKGGLAEALLRDAGRLSGLRTDDKPVAVARPVNEGK